jgi:hypothetical protein
MPEQNSMDNYAYERDLILLNNLLMKRLLQQRMRMNNASNESKSNSSSKTVSTSIPSKKTISDVYGMPGTPGTPGTPGSTTAQSSATMAVKDMKKHYSMVEPRKTTQMSAEMLKRNTRQVISTRQTPTRTHPVTSHHTSHHHNRNTNVTSSIASNNSSENLSPVQEDSPSEKPSPIGDRPPLPPPRLNHKLRTSSSNSGSGTSSGEATPCSGKQHSSTPGSSNHQPSSSMSGSASDSEQSFRKHSPTKSSRSQKTSSTIHKLHPRSPPCKQSNGKCTEENKKTCNQCPPSAHNTLCGSNKCPPQPLPQMQPSIYFGTPAHSSYRPFNYQAPSLPNPSFYFPSFNNSFNYPLIRTNFNSFPQYNPLQSFNFQSNPFNPWPTNYYQRPLDSIKPIKPMQFQPPLANGQTLLVL